MVCCAAIKCAVKPNQGIAIHRFPKDIERLRVWVANVGRANWQPTVHSRLCDLHFDNSQFEEHRADGVRKLKPNAIPTVFKYSSEAEAKADAAKEGARKRSTTKKRSSKSSLNGWKAKRRKKSFKDPVSDDDDDEDFTLASVKSSTGRSLRNIKERDDGEEEEKLPIAIGKLCKNTSGKKRDSSRRLRSSAKKKKASKSSSGSSSKNTEWRSYSEDQLYFLNSEVERLQTELSIEKQLVNNMKNEQNAQNDRLKKTLDAKQLELIGLESTPDSDWSDASLKKGIQLRFSCGEKGYDMLLAENHLLPAMHSLHTRMDRISHRPGIIHEIFEFLRLKVTSMGSGVKDCVLTLDEMAIQSGQYDRSGGCYWGKVTVPNQSGVATHALVFMLSGVSSQWKQTVAYHFVGDKVNGETLRQIILEIIGLSADSGLHVMCVTSDTMGSTTKTIHKAFGISYIKTKIQHPKSSGRYLYFTCNVSRLMKDLKNSLVNDNTITIDHSIVKKCKLPRSTVSFESVKSKDSEFEEEQYILIPKITNSDSDRYNEVKVSASSNLYAKSVSSGLRYLVEKMNYTDDLLTTAWFLDFMSHWFSLMSSRLPVVALSKNNALAYKKAIEHMETAIAMFESMKIGTQWRSIQIGIILSTASMLAMQRELLDRGAGYILTSRFSPNCLESFFHSVRPKSSTPSCMEFGTTLKMISIAQFLKCPTPSSQQEESKTRVDDFLQDRMKNEPRSSTSTSIACNSEPQILDNLDDFSPAMDTLTDNERSSLQQLANSCLNKLKASACDDCLSAALSDKPRIAKSALKDLKENKLDTLNNSKGAEVCMKLFIRAEICFKNSEKLLRGANVAHELVAQIVDSSKALVIPSCHSLKDRLVRQYVSLRLLHAQKVAAEKLDDEVVTGKSSEIDSNGSTSAIPPTTTITTSSTDNEHSSMSLSSPSQATDKD